MEIIVLIVVLAIVFIVESIYYRYHALEKLDLKVLFSKDVANYGEDIELIEVAMNRKRLPLPFIILKFESPRGLEFYDMTNVSASDHMYREDMLSMKSLSKHTRRIKVKCVKRGYYTFPRVGITTSDLFLTSRYNTDFKNDSELVVLPELAEGDFVEMLTSVTLSELQRRRTLLTDPFTLSGIREYISTDPMNTINWKASAKTGELMVNQRASTNAPKVHIFLNLEYYNQKRSVSLLEKSISLAYSYLCKLSEWGVQTSLYSNGIDPVAGAPLSADAAASSSELERKAMILGRLELKQPAVPFTEVFENFLEMTDHDDFIVVISPQSNAGFCLLMSDAKRRRPALNWIMPAYKITPDVELEPDIASSYLRWEVKGHD